MIALPTISSLTLSLQSYLGLQSQDPVISTTNGQIDFSEDWQVLGPFQIGTREAAWGADPLEFYGGFHSLNSSDDGVFRSSLAFNGSVSFTTTKATRSNQSTSHANADLSVSFSEIDWSFLQQIYGWTALQWQAWARGQIDVRSRKTQTLSLDLRHILEYWIDDQHYFGGDFYDFGRASHVLRLTPGIHTIEIRLVRDVRAMGGITDNPSVDVKLELQAQDESLYQIGDVLLPDRLGNEVGPLASTYGSVWLRNDRTEIVAIVDVKALNNICEVRLISQTPIKLVPGQSRPIGFQFDCIPGTAAYHKIEIEFTYDISSSSQQKENSLLVTPHPRNPQPSDGPQLITYPTLNGIVSYAILRPPPISAECGNEIKLPILLQFHGAGLEADDDLVKHALDSITDLCAWVLFPTGVTPWSSDDWHTWGFADVEAAIASIPNWIEHLNWNGPGVDTDRWLISGHSNGGQGTWYALTHRPDKVIAAAPVSGYSSIQNYVPFNFRHVADPGRTAVVQSSLNSFRHELLLSNAKHIPVMQQHGSADDNVPAYHSRLLSQLIQESGASSEYVEIEGMPHFWDGVFTTEHLKAFYHHHLKHENASISTGRSGTFNFSVVAANPADSGSRFGFRLHTLATPGQLGRLDVVVDLDSATCVLLTQNVLGLSGSGVLFGGCQWLSIDGVRLANEQRNPQETSIFWKSDDGQWRIEAHVAAHEEWRPPYDFRSVRQQGTIDAILRTNGAFQIVQHSKGAQDVVLQISRNLGQYFAADTEVSSDYQTALAASGNVISVVMGDDLPPGLLTADFSIRLTAFGVMIRDWHQIYDHVYTNKQHDDLGAIFLRPLQDDRLELVIWGINAKGLETAARLVPMMTGTGQPDFVVTNREMLWKGIDGAPALGFFDHRWRISRNSFFT